MVLCHPQKVLCSSRWFVVSTQTSPVAAPPYLSPPGAHTNIYNPQDSRGIVCALSQGTTPLAGVPQNLQGHLYHTGSPVTRRKLSTYLFFPPQCSCARYWELPSPAEQQRAGPLGASTAAGSALGRSYSYLCHQQLQNTDVPFWEPTFISEAALILKIVVNNFHNHRANDHKRQEQTCSLRHGALQVAGWSESNALA